MKTDKIVKYLDSNQICPQNSRTDHTGTNPKNHTDRIFHYMSLINGDEIRGGYWGGGVGTGRRYNKHPGMRLHSVCDPQPKGVDLFHNFLHPLSSAVGYQLKTLPSHACNPL